MQTEEHIQTSVLVQTINKVCLITMQRELKYDEQLFKCLMKDNWNHWDTNAHFTPDRNTTFKTFSVVSVKSISYFM